MYNNEKLIMLVQNNPVLWNTKLNGYRDKNVRELCWDLIGQEMYVNWLKMTEKQRNIAKKKMKDRWRHMRDTYYRCLKKPLRTKSKNIYADALYFLRPMYEKKHRILLLSEKDTTDTTEDDSTHEPYDKPEITKNSFEFQNEFQNKFEVQNEVRNEFEFRDEIFRTVSETSSETSTRKRIQSTIDDKLLDILNRRKTEEEDTDRAFLISLLPDYKQLDKDQKLDFRIGVLNLLQNIRRNVTTNLF